MNVLSVLSHPREDSLTFAVARSFNEGLVNAGHNPEVLDLYRENFDPRLFQADEPDWNDPNKQYSVAVEHEMNRLRRNDAISIIFPVWWYNLPAITKGWIDRVWNHGFAYGGGRKMEQNKILWIALAGESESSFKKRKYDKLLEHHLNIGIAGYCGIADSEVKIIYNTFGEGIHEDGIDSAHVFYQNILQQAYDLGKEF
ncbi:NAD(P)H oxidoreductase [Bacillus salipaludis]|uniref:NAD(P)H oxidoreductase n=1 Tax=Bacillus salipaludis TaxID=2547811 RepID=A0A4R5VXZ5_9BACI|nr:NAD(P)H oxidoreductase [Bacillus salipaludis]MDQ6594917.1 NAD(P)H oxidoreductase [Bacillus salipaludis]TDK64202.1 NAD(P)H oxidoreductase [Bacillus salipaludis]